MWFNRLKTGNPTASHQGLNSLHAVISVEITV